MQLSRVLSLMLLALILLLGAVLGPAWCGEGDAPAKAGEHEGLRKTLVEAWLAQRDLNLRYEMASDSKDPEVGEKVHFVDVRIVGRVHAIHVTSSQQSEDAPGAFTMVLSAKRLVLKYGDAEAMTGGGWSHHEARRLRVAEAWRAVPASLALPDPKLGTEPYGPHLKLDAEPRGDGTVFTSFSVSSAVGPFVPNWLDRAAWDKSTVSFLEDGAVLQLVSPGRRVRIQRATGVLLEIQQERTADASTTWIRSVAPTHTRRAWNESFGDAPEGGCSGTSAYLARMELSLRVFPMLHLERYLSRLPPAQRDGAGVYDELVRPIVEAACDDSIHRQARVGAGEKAIQALARWRTANPKAGADAAPLLILPAVASRYAEPTLQALRTLRAESSDVAGGNAKAQAAAQAAIERAALAFWLNSLERTVKRDDERRALTARFDALDSTILEYRWRITPKDASKEPNQGTLTVWTERGSLGVRWLDAAGRPHSIYLSPTRTVVDASGGESPDVAPGLEAWTQRHARLRAVAASLPSNARPDRVRSLVPFLVLGFESDAKPRPGVSVNILTRWDAHPIWLNPAPWSVMAIEETKAKVVIVGGEGVRMRIERATGILLGAQFTSPFGTGHLELAGRRPGDDAIAIWASAWERSPYSFSGLRWTLAQILPQIVDLLVLACDGRLADVPGPRRAKLAGELATAAFDDELLAGFLENNVQREAELVQSTYTQRKKATPNLNRDELVTDWAEQRGPEFSAHLMRDFLTQTRDTVLLREDATFDSAFAEALQEALAAIITERLMPLMNAELETQPR